MQNRYNTCVRGLLLPDQRFAVSKPKLNLNEGTKVRLVCDPVVATSFISCLAWRTGTNHSFFDGCTMRISNAKIDAAVASRWSCDPDTGQLFRDGIPYNVKPVEIKGRKYIHVHVAGQSKVRAHRLIWKLCYGVWPAGDIDHINGDSLDNRLCNLRDVSNEINCKNKANFKRQRKHGLPTGICRTKLKSGAFSYFAVVGNDLRGPCRKTIQDALSDRVKLLRDNGYSELHIEASTKGVV